MSRSNQSMTRSGLHALCASLATTAPDMPFGPATLVYRAGARLFALVPADEPLRLNLKCDPTTAAALRHAHPAGVLPGYHMNKKHWNTVVVGQLNGDLVVELVEHSFDLVANKSLARAVRSARASVTQTPSS